MKYQNPVKEYLLEEKKEEISTSTYTIGEYRIGENLHYDSYLYLRDAYLYTSKKISYPYSRKRTVDDQTRRK